MLFFLGQNAPAASVEKGGYKAKALAAKTVSVDNKCNNEELKTILQEVCYIVFTIGKRGEKYLNKKYRFEMHLIIILFF